MLIRDETPADRGAIRIVVDSAFADHPRSNGREGELVDALREAGALTLSLVAEDAGEIAGHVAMSPVAIDSASAWHGLGPIAVLPARQRRGVGSALVEAALSRLRANGAAGCVVFGEPRFYGRFGFRASESLRFPDGPPELFLALPFGPTVAAGAVRYHPAFALVG